QSPQTGDSLFADTRYGYKTWQIKADNTVEWIGDDFENYFTFGVQASTQERTATRPGTAIAMPAHPQGTENKLGIFAQNEYIWDEKLTLIAGARGDFHWVTPNGIDRPKIDGAAISPKLAALYQVNDTLGVFGSLAHTERLPTIDELYSVSAAKSASLGLQKEQANTVEGGFTLSGYDLLQSGDGASIKTTGFYSDLTDLIVSNTGSGVPYYGNVGEAHIYGVEVEGSYDSDTFFGSLAYSLTVGDNLVTDTPLTTVPQSRLVATLGAKNAEWGLSYGARVTLADVGRYISPEIVASPGRPPQKVADGPAEAFATLDLFASWKPDYGAFAGTELTAGIDNVFNADYRENLSIDRSTGRTFKLTLAKQFDY
ncbi:MAG TPA: TonB-dependent receptor, partial [Devosia sp.]|nr:TonB-dependent receptor [Devosia sp.]